MDVGVIVEGIEESQSQVLVYHRDALLRRGTRIHLFRGGEDGFRRAFDAMIVHVWPDRRNRHFFRPSAFCLFLRFLQLGPRWTGALVQ